MKACMRRSIGAVAAILLAGFLTSFAMAQGKPGADKLRVYFIDVDGGQSTLFVTPAGESLLIDTGWPGGNGLDADRIVARDLVQMRKEGAPRRLAQRVRRRRVDLEQRRIRGRS